MVPFKFRKNLAKNLLQIMMRSLREAKGERTSGEYFYPIQKRETQKAAVRSTHFQIRSEAHGAYIMLYAVAHSHKMKHGCKGLGLWDRVSVAFALVRFSRNLLYLK